MEKPADSRLKICTTLFFSMLYISAFTFGGGFVIVTLMKQRFVDKYKWIDEKEMLDITSISQSAPGAIAVNAAVMVGRKLGGIPGSICAVAGTVMPPLAIIGIISVFYNAFSANPYISLILKGMQAGVAAVILNVVCSLSSGYFKEKKIPEILIIALSFAAVFFFKVNVIIIILTAALIGIANILLTKRRSKRK